MLTPVVSEYCWKNYGPKVEAKFDKEVETALEGENSISQTFSDAWNRIIDNFDSEKLDGLKIKQKDTDYSDSEMVSKLKALTMLKARLMVENVSHLALFGVITAVALLVLALIKNIIGNVAELPVIGWINHGGGFIFGAVEAIVILIAVVRGASLLNIQFFQNLSEGTVLLKWLIGGDIQSAINGIQNLTAEDLKNISLEDLTTVDFKNVGNQVMELLKKIPVSEIVDGAEKLIAK